MTGKGRKARHIGRRCVVKNEIKSRDLTLNIEPYAIALSVSLRYWYG